MKWRKVWQCKVCGKVSREISIPEYCDKCSILVNKTNCNGCKHLVVDKHVGEKCNLSLFGLDILTKCNNFERKIHE